MTRDEIVALLEAGEQLTSACDLYEVTRNGMFGGPVDTERRFIPGLRRMYLGGRPLSLEDVDVVREWIDAHRQSGEGQ